MPLSNHPAENQATPIGASRLMIVTGQSGSGKSTALAAFEDSGFYCVDNLPVALLPQFFKLSAGTQAAVNGYAFVMDMREDGFLSQFQNVIENLNAKGYRFKIIFLKADQEILHQRYSQTRRKHPLARTGGLLEGISRERELLRKIRDDADAVIDTSRYTVHDLKTVVQAIARHDEAFIPMGIQVLSFGYKYGIPYQADLIIDVRFLANPYFDPHLKMLDGTHQAVRDFIWRNETARIFLDKYLNLLDYLIPLYDKEGKSYLTLAVGCTGGRHRSVAVSVRIYNHLRTSDRPLHLIHRDIDRR